MNIKKYQVSELASLRDAMLAIEGNSGGITYISSKEGKILGVATDGDIRRMFLQGGKLTDSINNFLFI